MDADFFPFSQAVWGGVITVNIFAILASAAIFSVFLRIAWLACVAFKTKQQPPEFVFFKTQLGVYAANLLFSNLVIAGSGLVNMYWLVNKGILANDACTAQAITMQIGNVAAAYFTVAMAMHTFITLVLQVGQSAIVGFVFILIGWATAIVTAITPHVRSRVYGPSGIACAVKTSFNRSQFFLHLLPIFIAALFSALLGSLIFLVLRGTLVVKGGFKLTLDPARRISRSHLLEQGTYNAFMLAIAKAVLWVPLAYVVLLGPYSVTQLLVLAGFQVPLGAQVFAAVCWFMIGVINVLLLYNIFRVLGPVIAIRSQLTSPGTLEKGPYTPSFISSGFEEKQQQQFFHHRQPSEANSVMSTASSRPLIRHNSQNNYIGQPIIPNLRTNEQTAAFFTEAADVPAAYSSPYHARQGSINSTKSTTRGPVPTRYPTPPRGATLVHASAFKGAHSVAPASHNGTSSPNSPASTYSVSKPVNTSVPHDLDDLPGPTSITADHYPRASYFETYYGSNYVPSTRSYSPKLKPLMLQGSLRDTK